MSGTDFQRGMSRKISSHLKYFTMEDVINTSNSTSNSTSISNTSITTTSTCST